MAGVLSVLLIDLSKLIALLPGGIDVPTITPLIKILSLIQPAVILLAAVLIGIVLSPKVGLSAPFAECVAAGGKCFPVLRPQGVPGLIGGIVGTLCVVLTSAVIMPYLMKETIERIHKFQELLPIPTRLLYGGITEELLMRWGLMTLLVWVAWRVLQRQANKPTTICFVLAILISAFVFGLGHLPAALMLLPELTVPVITFVIVANSAYGVVTGYLYWKFGLEAAMIAHVFGHVLLAIASYAGAYF
jgi:Type II CAAX prenyl endopeptidase Rce1-like